MAYELVTIAGKTFAVDIVTLPDGSQARVILDKVAFGALDILTPVDADHPLPVDAADGQVVALDATTLAALETIQANTGLDLTALATAVKQDAAKATLDAILAAIAGKLSVKQTGNAPPLGYAQASITASQALPTIPTGAASALVVPRAPIRWRDDGTAPTAGVGMYVAADQPLELPQGSLAPLRMIAVAGTVEVNVSFYGVEA